MHDIINRLNNLTPKQMETLRNKLEAKGIQLSDLKVDDTAEEIKKAKITRYYPASSVQKRLFILEEIEELGTSYNMPAAIKIKGRINIKNIENALNMVVSKHEILRTVFNMVDGEVVQEVCNFVRFKLELKESANVKISDITKKFIRPFELKKGPLLRYQLHQIAQEEYILLVDMHHIISDGVSMGIFMQEFIKAYNGKQLEDSNIQYKDFAVWENSIKNTTLKKHEKFWQDIFKEDVEVLNLPLDYKRPGELTFDGNTLSFEIGEKLTRKLNRLAKDNNVTLYMILLSAYNILLYKYTGQEDIVIGSPVAGRYHPGLDKLIGMFVNTIPMRNYPRGDKEYTRFLQEIKNTTIKCYEHGMYSLEDIIDKLSIKRHKGRNILFDTMLVLQNTEDISLELGNAEVELCNITPPVSKFDITLNIKEKSNNIIYDIEYNTNLFERETIERLSKHFVNILDCIGDKPNILISNISVLSEQDKSLINKLNETNVVYNEDTNLIDLFESQVINEPNGTALIFGEETITYNELNKRANSLAHNLRKKGICRNDIVALLVERSVEMIIGLLGILKAGAAYLPIDINYPVGRIQYILQDSQAVLLLVDKMYDITKYRELPIINLKNQKYYSNNYNNPVKINKANDLAYIIYTSGTTGKPKGVMVEHQNIANTIKWRVREYNSDYNHVVLQLFSYVFDGFVTSFFTPIVSGGTVVLLDELEAKNPECIKDCINKYKITHFIVVPSFYNTLLDCFSTTDLAYVKVITLAGEKITNRIIQKSKEKKETLEIVNEYGPTENSVATTIKRNIETNQKIFIGKPISNTHVYILDKDDNLCPIGMPGELCISGKGLARGYLNNQVLTKEKFISNPFKANERMYRTGDLCRLSSDGNIEFLDRIDKQVKIRGYRIEINEIVECLYNIPDVKQAFVCVKGGYDNLHLCAYLVIKKEVEIEEIKRRLSFDLPDYMIPNYYIFMDKIPLTNTGKVDERALPEPNYEIKILYKAPTNDVEKKLLKLFQEILKTKKIGINNSFFEMGGQSLKAGLLISKIHEMFNVIISIKAVFEHSTVSELASYISILKEEDNYHIRSVTKSKYYSTSWAQKNIYLLSQTEGIGITYNMPSLIKIQGKVNIEQLEKAICEIIKRHEILRTNFEMIDGEVVQVVSDDTDFKLQVININNDIRDIDRIIEGFVQPFDLSKSPLIRVCLVIFDENNSKLLIDMHHIIGDGTSIKLIINELCMFYKGEKLPDLQIQYRDYAIWQNELLNSDRIINQEEYWKQIFADEIPVLAMPLDFARPSIQSFKGDKITFELSKDLYFSIKNLCKQTQTTPFMFFLAAYYILIYKYTAQKDIIIGTPVEGRNNLEVNGLIGMFVNTLPLRIRLNSNMTFINFLSVVKETVLGGVENQNIPFIQLIDKLNIVREQSHNPLFDTMFVMNEMMDYQFEVENLTFVPDNIDIVTSKFDLTLEVSEVNETFKCELEYCTDLFKRAKMQQLLIHYSNLLENITNDTNQYLSKMQILSHKELLRVELFNSKEAVYEQTKTIHEIFEKQVKLTPHNIAISCNDNRVTYEELNSKANKVANKLRLLGIGPDSIVGIMANPSIEIIIGMLGIIKAGGAYLPIDVETPRERIMDILEDADVKLLLVNNDNIDYSYQVDKICVIEEIINDKTLLIDNLKPVSTSNNLVYVIYTSGSTGKPKGVLVEHRNLINYICWAKNMYLKDKNEVMPFYSSISFDLTVTSIFTPLLSGNQIIVYNSIEDDFVLHKILKDNKVTVIKLTPAHLILLKNINMSNSNLKRLIVGGDDLKASLAREISNSFSDNIEIYNEYGPTETVVGCMIHKYDEEKDNGVSVPIGYPTDNVQIYILDNDSNIVPIGVAGEIYIAGKGVVRGYIKRPELTDDKFIDNPFGIGKMYKTGDLGRWLPDGNIEFLGRIDNQVKIRGYRIELGEIEKYLLNYESINEAVVMARGQGEEKEIIAYYVAEKEIDKSKLKKQLTEKLPKYMIPQRLQQVDDLILTKNGKVNKKALLQLEVAKEDDVMYVPPITKMEKTLLNIWKNIINDNTIGIKHNFFDIGGHSLKAMQMVVQAEKEGIDVKLNQIMKYPTIEELSKKLHFKKEEKNLINNIQDINNQLNNQFQFLNKLVIYHVQNEVYVVLYSDYKSIEQKLNVLSYLKNYCIEDLYPHYIKKVDKLDSSIRLNGQITMENFEKKLGLRYCTDEEEDNIFIDIISQLEKFNNNLLQVKTDKYIPISPSQKMFMNFHTGFSGTVITIKHPINLKSFNKAFSRLIHNQVFMHSVLIKDNNNMMWQKLDITDKYMDIPYIDLSSYKLEEQEKLVKSIIQQYYFYPYEMFNSLLFRALLICHNEARYSLVIPFNHIIFDKISDSILKEKLFNYYNLIEQNEILDDTLIDEYETFIDNINSTFHEEKEILRMFNLKLYYNEHLKLSTKISRELKDFKYETQRITLEINTPFNLEEHGDNLSIQIGLDYILRVFKDYFNIDKVPINVLSYGRRYKDYECLNTIGAFVDLIPVLLDENYIKDTESLNQLIKKVARNNLNFLNIYDKYKNIKNICDEIFSFLITFNFLGRYESTNEFIYTYLDEYINEKRKEFGEMKFFGISIELTYNMNTLRFFIQAPNFHNDWKNFLENNATKYSEELFKESKKTK
ncbi:amino acid adenylation domain-containing protein [Vallitalea maricola]|uniref:Uncharacterized protein n=1 Tax=Vallitalea maricola TaxID=3074433 RepID=A0ACB5UM32_9FIRM|nr:hypothetical protein AN2V17_28280 [Vallitalea sp. AN17-2]